MRDLLNDWRHWSVAERCIAVALIAMVALTAPLVAAVTAAAS
jgi:hypothetical protein